MLTRLRSKSPVSFSSPRQRRGWASDSRGWEKQMNLFESCRWESVWVNNLIFLIEYKTRRRNIFRSNSPGREERKSRLCNSTYAVCIQIFLILEILSILRIENDFNQQAFYSDQNFRRCTRTGSFRSFNELWQAARFSRIKLASLRYFVAWCKLRHKDKLC